MAETITSAFLLCGMLGSGIVSNVEEGIHDEHRYVVFDYDSNGGDGTLGHDCRVEIAIPKLAGN